MSNDQDHAVRYAVIGFGGIAENRIAREGFALDRRRFAPLREAVLLGAWSRSDRRRRAAEELGLHWYESLESLLADERLDAVFIAGNNATHVPYALQALAAGKHVILEKPMGVTSAEAEAVTATAAARRLSLSVDHMMRRNGFNRKARELILSGACGTVRHAELHVQGGFGSLIMTWLANNGLLEKTKVRFLTMPDSFIEQATIERQYELAGLNARSIANAVAAMIG